MNRIRHRRSPSSCRRRRGRDRRLDGVRGASAQTDIVGTAAAAGKFTTLTKLLKRAGLVAALQQPGPYTVFAPTDAAFAKVPKKTLNALLRDKAKLKAVLLYHVVAGKVTANKVVKLSLGEDAERQERPHPRRRQNVFVERREGHDRRRHGDERRDPRDQPRADPAGLTATAPRGGRSRLERKREPAAAHPSGGWNFLGKRRRFPS